MFGLPPPPLRLNARVVVARPLPTIPNPLLLKARKNFDLSTDRIHLLSSEKYKKLSGRTIKLLLFQHAKKKPFGKISLGSKVPPLAKIIGRNVKNFSYHTENQDPEFQRSERKLLRFIASSYKYLERLDASKLDIQNKSSLASLAKLNHLQNLRMKLTAGKSLPSPRFFQNLKRLQHLTLSILESPQNKETDLATLAGFLYHLTLLPSIESYNIDIRTKTTEKSEYFVGTVLYYVSLLKAKRFSVKIQCSEDIDLKVETFGSFLENVDTLELRYSGNGPNPTGRVNFQTPTSKKLILLLKPSQRGSSSVAILNACTSLENLYLEESQTAALLTALNLPQTLKALTLRLSSPQSPHEQYKSWKKFWEDALSSMGNLESLSLILHNSDQATLQWTSRLPKRVSLKSLKQYHLKLREDILRRQSENVEYMNFLTEWSQTLKDLSNLEGLSLDMTFLLLYSLDFFTEALASFQQLKCIQLNLVLSPLQKRETLKFTIPSQPLPKLEHISLGLSQYVSKDSAAKLLQDFFSCENLQSLTVSGLAFDEENAISTLKKLAHLKTLQIETTARNTLRLNSKKEFIKCKPTPL